MVAGPWTVAPAVAVTVRLTCWSGRSCRMELPDSVCTPPGDTEQDVEFRKFPSTVKTAVAEEAAPPPLEIVAV